MPLSNFIVRFTRVLVEVILWIFMIGSLLSGASNGYLALSMWGDPYSDPNPVMGIIGIVLGFIGGLGFFFVASAIFLSPLLILLGISEKLEHSNAEQGEMNKRLRKMLGSISEENHMRAEEVEMLAKELDSRDPQ